MIGITRAEVYSTEGAIFFVESHAALAVPAELFFWFWRHSDLSLL